MAPCCYQLGPFTCVSHSEKTKQMRWYSKRSASLQTILLPRRSIIGKNPNRSRGVQRFHVRVQAYRQRPCIYRKNWQSVCFCQDHLSPFLIHRVAYQGENCGSDTGSTRTFTSLRKSSHLGTVHVCPNPPKSCRDFSEKPPTRAGASERSLFQGTPRVTPQQPRSHLSAHSF